MDLESLIKEVVNDYGCDIDYIETLKLSFQASDGYFSYHPFNFLIQGAFLIAFFISFVSLPSLTSTLSWIISSFLSSPNVKAVT